jgi:hypothetical protein
MLPIITSESTIILLLAMTDHRNSAVDVVLAIEGIVESLKWEHVKERLDISREFAAIYVCGQCHNPGGAEQAAWRNESTPR